MKYAQYCPECYEQGITSELKHMDSKFTCVQCGNFDCLNHTFDGEFWITLEDEGKMSSR